MIEYQSTVEKSPPVTEKKGTEVATPDTLNGSSIFQRIQKTSPSSSSSFGYHDCYPKKRGNFISFEEILQKNGIPVPSMAIGRTHFARWGKAKMGDKPFYAKAFEGGIHFGDWSQGISETWFEESFEKKTPQEQSILKDHVRKFQEEERKERQDTHERVALEAEAFFEGLPPTGESAYLTRKGVKAHGVRFGMDEQGDSFVVVPVRDRTGKIWSLERIREDGTKRFQKGGRIDGGFHLIGTPQRGEELLFCEGYATGASLYEATGMPVVVAFSVQNLEKVVQIFHQEGTYRLRVCADNDAYKPQNAGLDMAQKIQHQWQIPFIFPDFTEEERTAFEAKTGKPPTDFNDLYVLKGKERISTLLTEAQSSPPEPPTSPYRLLQGERGKEDGVYYFSFDKNGEPLAPKYICSPLEILAKTRNTHGDEWGYLLTWVDADGRRKKWAMPASMLKGSGDEYRGRLLAGGVRIESPSLLAKYIRSSSTSQRVRCTHRIGWHDSLFVFADNHIVGTGPEQEILFQSEHPLQAHHGRKGSLAEWQTHVARLCEGSSRLAFAVSVAFASCLLEPLGVESGGFHFRGVSSSGKSTALKVAASVWGSPSYKQSWNATRNSLEGMAQAHNDTLLILDELQQVDPRDAGEAAYLLGNGMGRGRSTKEGTSRSVATWRLLFLSAGEISLGEHMRLGGKKSTAGQEVRLLDIPADSGAEMGIFEVLHGVSSPQKLAQFLSEEAVSQNYGHGGVAFLEGVMAEKSALSEAFRAFEQQFTAQNVPPRADGQVRRAASRFALVAFAGERAIRYGIVPWSVGEAERAAAVCFQAWIQSRGGVQSTESLRILEHLRHFFHVNESKFQWLPRDLRSQVQGRIGFIKGEEVTAEDGTTETHIDQYIFLPEVFKREVCQGFDTDLVLKELLSRGILLKDAQGKSTRQNRLPDSRPQRCYVLSHKYLYDGGEEQGT